jgi:hypothetical protein
MHPSVMINLDDIVIVERGYYEPSFCTWQRREWEIR